MKRLTIAVLTCALCLAAACGDDDNGNNQAQNQNPNGSTGNNTSGNNTSPNVDPNADENIFPGVDFGRAEISAAEGGTVALASGRGEIEIPAGALSEDTEVVIRVNPTTANHDDIFNSGGGPIPFTINLEPAGTTLSAPATLRFLVPVADLALANTDGQVWQFALVTNASGEPAVHPYTETLVGDDFEIVAEVDTFDDYSPLAVGKVKLVPSCTTCAVGMDSTLTVDVENVLAPTIGFSLVVSPGDLAFETTESTGGVAAPMTHELVDFTFQCSAPGVTTVAVDFIGDLGPESPTFGYGAPVEAEITCE